MRLKDETGEVLSAIAECSMESEFGAVRFDLGKLKGKLAMAPVHRNRGCHRASMIQMSSVYSFVPDLALGGVSALVAD